MTTPKFYGLIVASRKYLIEVADKDACPTMVVTLTPTGSRKVLLRCPCPGAECQESPQKYDAAKPFKTTFRCNTYKSSMYPRNLDSEVLLVELPSGAQAIAEIEIHGQEVAVSFECLCANAKASGVEQKWEGKYGNKSVENILPVQWKCRECRKGYTIKMLIRGRSLLDEELREEVGEVEKEHKDMFFE